MCGNRAFIDVLKINVFTKARQSWHRYISVFVHWIDDAVQVAWYFIVVDKRVQQSSLVPGGVRDCSDNSEVSSAPAMDFTVHVERLSEMGDLHARANSANVIDSDPGDVTRFTRYPLCAGVEFSVSVFGADDGDFQLVCKPAVRLG